MKHIFIIGSRGLPAKYGGFETFVAELIHHKENPNIQYHVACLSDETHHEHFDYYGADCFTIKAPKLGPARVIAYDMMAINYALKIVKEEEIDSPIFYILGNTIGGFIQHFAKKIHKIGGKVLVNPDGLEWKRAKWPKPVQMYLKTAEKLMAKQADLVIADNEGIEDYINSTYPSSKTTCIAYGTDLKLSSLQQDAQKVRDWYRQFETKENQYYLIVGRFVPENNYETMIKEFMSSDTSKDLIIIANVKENVFYKNLLKNTNCDADQRIKFVGTVYDQELLKYIREHAFAYLHGHEVGGTNPGLLEALAHTAINLVLDVDFNQKVALDTVVYWSKEEGILKRRIEEVEANEKTLLHLGPLAKDHMRTNYSWETIVSQYEGLFLS